MAKTTNKDDSLIGTSYATVVDFQKRRMTCTCAFCGQAFETTISPQHMRRETPRLGGYLGIVLHKTCRKSPSVPMDIYNESITHERT